MELRSFKTCSNFTNNQPKNKNMNWNVSTILAVIAGGLAVVGIIKPQWPLVAVSCLLLAVAIVCLTNGK
jgi:hypothetical protein